MNNEREDHSTLLKFLKEDGVKIIVNNKKRKQENRPFASKKNRKHTAINLVLPVLFYVIQQLLHAYKLLLFPLHSQDGLAF